MHVRAVMCRCLTLILLSGTRAVLSQEIRGSVPQPPDAPGRTVLVVTLLDSAGRRLESTVVDGKGNFHLKLPGAGAYSLRLDALGRRGHLTPRFLVDSAETLSYTHAWPEPSADTAIAVPTPPIPGEPRDTTAAAPRDSAQRLPERRIDAKAEPERIFGLDARMLAIKPIGRERLDSLTSRTSDFASVLRLLRVPGLRTFGSGRFTCAITPGSIIRPAGAPCSHIVIDGARMPWPFDLNMIDPQSIDRIVVLRAIEATQFYGTGDGNGMLLIFTKIGPPTRKPRQ